MTGGVLAAFLAMEGFLRLAKPQIFEVHPPGMYTADPEVGYVLTPGYEGYVTRPEYRARFNIDQSGLRGAAPRPRQSNTFRILVLGDSQAWGFGVNDEDTFSVRLENLLAEHYAQLDVQVLNGGVPGYGTADELAFLRSRGEALQPDLVIVQFLSVNDMQENRAPARTWATIRDGMLTIRDTAAANDPAKLQPLWLQAKQWLKGNSHLASLLFDTMGYIGTRAGVLGPVDALWGEDFAEEDVHLATDLLAQIAQTAADLGARSLFLYTTGQAQVIQETYEPLRSLSVVENAARAAGVPWLDATERLRRRSDRYELYHPRDGHWTPAGHQAIAEILADEIINLGLMAGKLGE
jgi:lysophospholipase L1-like esterase